jgi:hypothetical protein
MIGVMLFFTPFTVEIAYPALVLMVLFLLKFST